MSTLSGLNAVAQVFQPVFVVMVLVQALKAAILAPPTVVPAEPCGVATAHAITGKLVELVLETVVPVTSVAIIVAMVAKTALTVPMTVVLARRVHSVAMALVIMVSGVEIVLETAVNVLLAEMVHAMAEKIVQVVQVTAESVLVVEMVHVMDQKVVQLVPQTVDHAVAVAFVETSLAQPSKAAQPVHRIVDHVLKTKLGSRLVVVT